MLAVSAAVGFSLSSELEDLLRLFKISEENSDEYPLTESIELIPVLLGDKGYPSRKRRRERTRSIDGGEGLKNALPAPPHLFM
jgi:hypothetical protein